MRTCVGVNTRYAPPLSHVCAGSTSGRLCLGSRLSQGLVVLRVLGWHCATLGVILSSLISSSFYYGLWKNFGSVGPIVPFTIKGSKLECLKCHQLHQRLNRELILLTNRFIVTCTCSKPLRTLKYSHL